jgi:hypothetical protein
MKQRDRAYLQDHSAHDFQALAARWRRLAQDAALALTVLTTRSGLPVYALRDRRRGDGPANYASAGVHGDEPAAALALLEWAEERPARFGSGAWLLFPCLNPWGLAHNRRSQEDGVDLNREFHSATDPLVLAWRGHVTRQPLALSLLLHEDYDGRGTYIYEHGHHGQPLAPRLLKRAAPAIPPDPRTRIDGRRARDGVIEIGRRLPKLPGLPEALELHRLGSARTLTIETPSEFALPHRVDAHKRMLGAAFG